MKKVVTVTSQGQITIPADMRRALNVSSSRELILTLKDKKVTLEPTEDIYSLFGSLKKHPKVQEKLAEYKTKKMSNQEIIKAEEKGAILGFIKDRLK